MEALFRMFRSIKDWACKYGPFSVSAFLGISVDKETLGVAVQIDGGTLVTFHGPNLHAIGADKLEVTGSFTLPATFILFKRANRIYKIEMENVKVLTHAQRGFFYSFYLFGDLYIILRVIRAFFLYFKYFTLLFLNF